MGNDGRALARPRARGSAALSRWSRPVNRPFRDPHAEVSGVESALIRNDEDFAALMPQWWELWHAVPNAMPFQTPAWLLAWWKVFSQGELRCATVWRGGAPVAIGPFYVAHGPSGARLLPVGIALSDYLGVLVEPQSEA